MIEILGFVYLTCLVISMGLIAWQLVYIRSQLNSKKLKILNQNLEKIHLFWSNSKSEFEKLEPNSIDLDRKNTQKSILLVGILGFASLPGFLLLLLVILSLRFLAKSRLEKKTFASELALNPNLSEIEVQKMVEALKHDT